MVVKILSRKQAMEWWNNITMWKCLKLTEKYYEKDRAPDTLTGKEIEMIWQQETGGDFSHIPDENICTDYDEAGFNQPKITPELLTILRSCYKKSTNHITFPCYSFKEEYLLSPDDRDWVTFHRGVNAPSICDKLMVSDYETTEQPIWKDWYMTINYHS